jgi:hypothetical protein
MSRPDYVRLNLALLLRTRGVYLNLLIFLVLVGISVFPGQLALPGGIYFAFLFLVAMVIIYAYVVITLTRRMERRSFFTPRSYTLGEGGLNLKTATADVSLKWTEIQRWRLVTGYYLLYLSRTSFLPLRRADIPPGELAAFEQLLRRRVQARGRG